MVPQPESTPMPDHVADKEERAKLYSLYMRPWVLDPSAATEHKPHILDPDKRPSPQQGGSRRTRMTSKTKPPPTAECSFAKAWTWYLRGNVVSRHARRIITQFMSACCGRTTHMDDDETCAAGDANQDLQRGLTDLTLTHVHGILARMSRGSSGADEDGADDTGDGFGKLSK